MISFDLGVRIAFGEGIIKEAAFEQDLLRMVRMSTESPTPLPRGHKSAKVLGGHSGRLQALSP